jgi:hypothetical protein
VIRQTCSGFLNSQNRPLEVLNTAFGKGIGHPRKGMHLLSCIYIKNLYSNTFPLAYTRRPDQKKRDAVHKMNCVSLEKKVLKVM